MEKRDDIYEYSLDNHHSDEEGKSIRKQFIVVLVALSAVTLIEVAMGMAWSRDASKAQFLKYTFIFMTLVKAGGITWYFMHLGDEKKNFRAIILVPFFVLIGYLVTMCLNEGIYNGTIRPVLKHYFGF